MHLYISFPLLLLSCETAQVSRKPKVPRDNCNLLFSFAVPRITCPIALPIALKLQSVFPCSPAAFHHTLLADLLSHCPFARAPPWDYGTRKSQSEGGSLLFFSCLWCSVSAFIL